MVAMNVQILRTAPRIQMFTLKSCDWKLETHCVCGKALSLSPLRQAPGSELEVLLGLQFKKKDQPY